MALRHAAHHAHVGKHHRGGHFIIDLAEHVDQTADAVATISKQVNKSAAIRAFRATQPLEPHSKLLAPMMNRAGNLRGIVISRRARVVFNFSTNIASKFEKYASALALAGIVLEIYKDLPRYEAVNHSNASLPEKSRMYTLITSTAILRSVTGVVPTSAHLIARSLDGYLGLAELAGATGAREWRGRIHALDVQIKSAHQEIFSPEGVEKVGEKLGDGIYNLLDTHIHFH